jgi:co-chaperonin GroES (HSP10)
MTTLPEYSGSTVADMTTPTRLGGVTIQPLNDQVALVEDGPLHQSDTVVLVPEGKALRFLRGKVMAVGPGNLVNTPRGLERVKIEIRLGASVCFDRLACVEIRRDGTKYFVCGESDCRCEFVEPMKVVGNE